MGWVVSIVCQERGAEGVTSAIESICETFESLLVGLNAKCEREELVCDVHDDED